MKNKDKIAFLSTIAYIFFVYIGMHVYVMRERDKNIEATQEIRYVQMQQNPCQDGVKHIERYEHAACIYAHYLDAEIAMK